MALFAIVICLSFTNCSFSNDEKPYSLSLEGNNLYITIPYPTIGVIEFGKVNWGKVRLSDVVEDVYQKLRDSSLYGECSLYVRLEKNSTDKYGNSNNSYDEQFLMNIPVDEVRKYNNSNYFNQSYRITEKIENLVSPHTQYQNNASSSVSSTPSATNNTYSNENYGRKRFDFFMNVLRNQDASFEDFVFAGLTTENSHLLDRARYENSEKVRSSITDEFGNFDRERFNVLYNRASEWYERLKSVDTEEIIKSRVTYHRDNIFAPIEQRRSGPEFYY